MSKFQPPMLNDDACRVSTDKQTHKHTHKIHTYWVKTEETFFLPPSFLFSIFISLIVWTLKRRFPKTCLFNSKWHKQHASVKWYYVFNILVEIYNGMDAAFKGQYYTKPVLAWCGLQLLNILVNYLGWYRGILHGIPCNNELVVARKNNNKIHYTVEHVRTTTCI